MKRTFMNQLSLNSTGDESKLSVLSTQSDNNSNNNIDMFIKDKDVALSPIELPEDDLMLFQNKDMLSSSRCSNVFKYNSYIYVVSYRSESFNVANICNESA